MKADDGYAAYLNGVEVARDRLKQEQPTFDSTANSRPEFAVRRISRTP